MAYDPKTGEWKDEELGVQKRVEDLTNQNSSYMKSAELPATQAANRRGLLNSSMAIQAAQTARINAALPIASQESSQANQRYMQGRGLQADEMTQKRGIASNEALTREGYANQRGMQSADIASREGMQGRELENQRWMSQFDAATREKLAGMDIASRERLQQADIESNKWLAQFDATQRERLQTLDANTRKEMQALDIEAQQRIAGMNVAESSRADAMRAVVSLEQGYASMLQTIMNNPDIPADVRQEYMDHAARVRESNIALVEQFYNVDLQWDEAA